jgi:hypothetical protein
MIGPSIVTLWLLLLLLLVLMLLLPLSLVPPQRLCMPLERTIDRCHHRPFSRTYPTHMCILQRPPAL